MKKPFGVHGLYKIISTFRDYYVFSYYIIECLSDIIILQWAASGEWRGINGYCFCTWVASGERAGYLEKELERVAKIMQTDDEQRQQQLQAK